MKIFWRLILPFVLAAVLAVGLTFEVMGHGSGRLHGSFRSLGPSWFRFGGAFLIGGIVFFFVASFWKTLHWGKESEEFAELLKEEEADEEKGRREGASR